MDSQQLLRRRLRLVRYYLRLADSHYRIEEDNSRFAAIIFLHEALEAELIAVSSLLNISVGQRETIDGYLQKIESKIDQSLPLKAEILRFNRARVSAKHALTLPSDKDIEGFINIVPAFCRSIANTILSLELDTVSLVPLIDDEDLRNHLSLAENFISEGQYFSSLLESRKAFYLKFLRQFDIRCFEGKKDGESYGFLDDRMMCRAPAYAKSNRCIRDNVKTPLDYIVEDHSYLDNECLKNGIRPSDFWNVWRLTPKVVLMEDNRWVNSRPMQLPEEIEKSDAQYVLDTIVDILLTFQATSSRVRTRSHQDLCIIEVPTGTPIYKKCSLSGGVEHVVEDGPALLSTFEAIPSLDGGSYFWSVMHLEKGGPYFSGFLHEGDFDGVLHPYDPARLGIKSNE